MNLQVDFERLRLAHRTVREELLAERAPDGRWVGEVASSPLATAAAIGALVVAHRRVELNCCGMPTTTGIPTTGAAQTISDRSNASLDAIVDGQLSELVVGGLHWLARVQNSDGGWGDCRGARSNLAATAMVMAAFRLTGVPAKYADLMERADEYIDACGGLNKLRQARDSERAWSAPILAACALAEMLPWRKVPSVALERYCGWAMPRLSGAASLGEGGKSTAVQVAAGLAKLNHAPPLNPLVRLLRRACVEKSLDVLERCQAADGSVQASPFSTALVVMSLADSGLRDHSIVQKAIEFLLATVRADVTWSVVADLSTRNTALATSALAGDEFSSPTEAEVDDEQSAEDSPRFNIVGSVQDFDGIDPRPHDDSSWLISCQHTADRCPTGVPAGGWSWSDATGAEANIVDTAHAVAALAGDWEQTSALNRPRLEWAATRGIDWLLDQQLQHGGWVFEAVRPNKRTRSKTAGEADATAEALVALAAWRRIWHQRRSGESAHPAVQPKARLVRMRMAVERAVAWLANTQREDGSFAAVGHGNEHQPAGQNPVAGTSRVLTALAAVGQLSTPLATRAADWLVRAQHTGGGWGPPRTPLDYSGVYQDGSLSWRVNDTLAKSCSVEETAWAVAALMPLAKGGPAYTVAVNRGLEWLLDAVEKDLLIQPAVIGVWEEKFWYYERLNPLTAAMVALSAAMQELAVPTGGETLRV